MFLLFIVLHLYAYFLLETWFIGEFYQYLSHVSSFIDDYRLLVLHFNTTLVLLIKLLKIM